MLTDRELGDIAGVPRSTMRDWRTKGLAGVKLTDRSRRGLLEFIYCCGPHPSLRQVRYPILVAAMQNGSPVEIPKRFKVPPPMSSC